MIRILVADDHTVVRRGIKQILSETADLVAAGEAGNAQEVLDRIRGSDCDVVLLDISMPGGSGMDVLKQIKAENPGLPVLILTVYPEAHYAVRALRAGASGYLTKESLPEELIRAIRIASQGRKYVSASLGERLALEVSGNAERRSHERLSDREYQVLCMIASGKTVTEIAGDLSLSVKTISTYRARILGKMGMKTNAELTRYAVENGLAD